MEEREGEEKKASTKMGFRAQRRGEGEHECHTWTWEGACVAMNTGKVGFGKAMRIIA